MTVTDELCVPNIQEATFLNFIRNILICLIHDGLEITFT